MKKILITLLILFVIAKSYAQLDSKKINKNTFVSTWYVNEKMSEKASAENPNIILYDDLKKVCDSTIQTVDYITIRKDFTFTNGKLLIKKLPSGNLQIQKNKKNKKLVKGVYNHEQLILTFQRKDSIGNYYYSEAIVADFGKGYLTIKSTLLNKIR